MRIAIAIFCLIVCVDITNADVIVTGTGRISYVPDRATFSVTIVADGESVTIAAKKCNETTKVLLDALAKAKIPEKSIVATHRVGPYRGGYANRVIAVQATNILTITVAELEKMVPILDIVTIRREGVQMALEMTNSNVEKLMDEARQAAVVDARRKAELYARSANVKLGSVTSIVEVAATPTQPQPGRYGRNDDTVEIINQSAIVELRVTFALKTGAN